MVPDADAGIRRNYVTKSVAMSKGLVSVSGNNFTLRADDTTVPSSSASGRDSVRIQSKKSYNTHVTVYVSSYTAPSLSPTLRSTS